MITEWVGETNLAAGRLFLLAQMFSPLAELLVCFFFVFLTHSLFTISFGSEFTSPDSVSSTQLRSNCWRADDLPRGKVAYSFSLVVVVVVVCCLGVLVCWHEKKTLRTSKTLSVALI